MLRCRFNIPLSAFGFFDNSSETMKNCYLLTASTNTFKNFIDVLGDKLYSISRRGNDYCSIWFYEKIFDNNLVISLVTSDDDMSIPNFISEIEKKVFPLFNDLEVENRGIIFNSDMFLKTSVKIYYLGNTK